MRLKGPPYVLSRLATWMIALGLTCLSASCALLTPATSGSTAHIDHRRDDPDDDETLHQGERDADTAFVSGSTHFGQFRGQLDRDVTGYQSDPAAFYKLMKGQGWHGRLRNRKCGGPKCTGSVTQTKLIIQAIEDAHTVPVGLPTGNPGVVIGRVMNVGDARDGTLPIDEKPLLRPTDQYYFVVRPGTPDLARLQIAHLAFDLSGRPASLIVKDATGFAQCHKYTHPLKQAKADFRDCNRHEEQQRDGGEDDALAPTPLAFDAMAWFSCDLGCCTAQWPP